MNLFKWSKIYFSTVFSLLITAIFLIQCTSGGFQYGNGDESSIRKQASLPGLRLDKISKGTRVEITFKNDKSFIGRFYGYELLEPDVYRLVYLEHMKNMTENPKLPKPGEIIDIAKNDGLHIDAEFIGFDYQRICIRPIRDTISQWSYLKDINKIGCGKRVFEGKALEDLTTSGRIPLMSALAIEDENFRNLVAVHEITKVTPAPID